jgi:drug/metabolite transporter (DMT)-like permease
MTRGYDQAMTSVVIALASAACFALALVVTNGAAVLLLYLALGGGPVSLVSPLVATYPLFTLVFGFAFSRREPLAARMIGGVALSVAGVMLLLAG